ncbi:hypothetical protein HPB50_001460 [Hyalomma asiaticum]|uniref:Uncharacterized protein n=1 Tax=Hyalomma asiaticum TaxID=266040 RepID=A0ACB7RIS8_HYAAI|nr:hypothetical protein HPB50_001460 [Hyalomma asiaticum]
MPAKLEPREEEPPTEERHRLEHPTGTSKAVSRWPRKCSYCEKVFRQKCDLDKHLNVHTGERTYPCDLCLMAFARKDSLKRHSRLHLGDRPFRCRF